MKKQQKKRADAQMVVANRQSDTRQKNRKHKAVHSDETPLLISQSLSNTSLSVEHAHDNPLDEITLGEYDMTVSMTLDKIPTTPKRMDFEVDREPEGKHEAESDVQAEGKKMKKKEVKKEKAKQMEESDEKDKEKEKKEKKTKKKDKAKESDDQQKTNKTTKQERKKKHLQEASTQEMESVMEVASPEKNKRGESDESEKEEESQNPPVQSPKRKKKLDTSRCQISNERKDEEIQEKEKKEKKTTKAEKATPSLASLNSNYRENSSSSSGSNERSTSPLSVEDLEKFALRPAPRDVTIQCRVTRDRRGMEKGIYPTYYLHMEKEDGKRVFLMAGRKRKKCKTSNYLISTDPTNLSRDTNCYIGKLRSNVLGTKFTVYDGGENPEKKPFVKECESVRQELAAICYETNVLGFKGPRKMTVIIPGMLENDERVAIRPKNELETLLVRHANNYTDKLVTLVNKSPSWNEQTQSYVLNFHGRVTQASVKNFQIIHPDNGTDHHLRCVNNFVFTINCSLRLAPSENTSDSNGSYWLTITETHELKTFGCVLTENNGDDFCSVTTYELPPDDDYSDIFDDTDNYKISLCHKQKDGYDICKVLDEKYLPEKNIKPNAPCCLTVSHNSSQRHFTWESTYERYKEHNDLTDNLKYQLRYYTRGDKNNVISYDINTDSKNYSLDEHNFAPDTNYSARVRSSPNLAYYQGEWSDWSSEVHWRTGVRRWRQSAFIPTPAPYFHTLYSDCQGDFKSWVVTQEITADILRTEETLQIDTLTKCADVQEEECQPQFELQVMEGSIYSNIPGCDTRFLGIPYAVSTMAPPSNAGSSHLSLTLSSQPGSPAEGDSGCWLSSHTSLERDPPWYCNEYCTLSAFQQTSPVAAEH
ncbi:hypothetical protein L3Q82_010712 [Scortum barcoo]|uniref:Uncharacterized protein n=1 Tax=Scortum barcoo TaxID=214431 RepID=A0ACB8WDU3_9TELE|nr:hypothetical protein L3Q82_010712 [Scortum barcoo]